MENETLDTEILQANLSVPEQHIISVEKFIVISLITCGTYPLWWTYKAWRFFKQLEKSDTMPFWRTFFSIVYLYSLFDKIQAYANKKGNEKRYNSETLFAFIIIINIMNKLPFPFGLISIFSCLFFIKPFKALNFVKENTSETICIKDGFFNYKLIISILIGLIFWYLVILVMDE